MNVRTVLLALAIKNKGDWNAMYQALREKPAEGLDESLCEGIADSDYMTFNDPDYPDMLRNSVMKPPLVLFTKGDKSLLNAKGQIALLSSRGEKASQKALDLIPNEKVYVVTDNFDIDSIMGKGKIIMWSASPLSKTDADKVHKVVSSGGLVVSELPDDADKDKNSCMMRTVHMPATSESVAVVTPIKRQSGSSVAIMSALQAGKDIYVIPTPIESDDDWSNNSLISDGAFILYEQGQLA